MLKSSFSLRFLLKSVKKHNFQPLSLFKFSEKKPSFDNDPNKNNNFPPKNDFSKNEVKEDEDDNSFFNEGKKSYYIFFVASVGLIAAYLMMQTFSVVSTKKIEKNKNINKTKYTGKADIGGPWKLKDTEGNIVTDKDFKGKYYLLYFGFCNCPDICPLTLHKLSRAMIRIESMPESKYFDLKCVFVSVDPDRDNSEKIKRFLNLFEYKKIIGLTAEKNDSVELKEMMQKFKIYASKIYYEQNEDNKMKNAYTIDHTIITYLMDQENNYLNYLGSNINEMDLASLIVDNILDNEKNKVKKIA